MNPIGSGSVSIGGTASMLGSLAKPAIATITSDISTLIAKTEANEYTVSRIWGRLFGSQPPQDSQCIEEQAGVVLDADIARVNRSANRTREMLEQLEVRLG